MFKTNKFEKLVNKSAESISIFTKVVRELVSINDEIKTLILDNNLVIKDKQDENIIVDIQFKNNINTIASINTIIVPKSK
jgi:hypothetical protein